MVSGIPTEIALLKKLGECPHVRAQGLFPEFRGGYALAAGFLLVMEYLAYPWMELKKHVDMRVADRRRPFKSESETLQVFGKIIQAEKFLLELDFLIGFFPSDRLLICRI